MVTLITNSSGSISSLIKQTIEYISKTVEAVREGGVVQDSLKISRVIFTFLPVNVVFN